MFRERSANILSIIYSKHFRTFLVFRKLNDVMRKSDRKSCTLDTFWHLLDQKSVCWVDAPLWAWENDFISQRCTPSYRVYTVLKVLYLLGFKEQRWLIPSWRSRAAKKRVISLTPARCEKLIVAISSPKAHLLREIASFSIVRAICIPLFNPPSCSLSYVFSVRSVKLCCGRAYY